MLSLATLISHHCLRARISPRDDSPGRVPIGCRSWVPWTQAHREAVEGAGVVAADEGGIAEEERRQPRVLATRAVARQVQTTHGRCERPQERQTAPVVDRDVRETQRSDARGDLEPVTLARAAARPSQLAVGRTSRPVAGRRPMTAGLKTLKDAFLGELRDAYDFEHQLVNALPTVAAAAHSTMSRQPKPETQRHTRSRADCFSRGRQRPSRESRNPCEPLSTTDPVMSA